MTGPAAEFVWFEVSEYVRPRRPDPVVCRVHAKNVGRTTTACGVPALSMLREWNRAFDVRSREARPDCRLAVYLFAREA
jgi:hypothetical protein